MNFGQALASGFSNYVNFSGRAVRSEYWYWVLFSVICSIVASLIDSDLFDYTFSPLQTAFNLATFLPGLAVMVRRLHDIDRTGWWILITFTIIGIVLLIYWNCQPGTPGPNRYGPDPFASGGPLSRPAVA
jgi:uncharacterized membrane protein YhaH (DUF805 family)